MDTLLYVLFTVNLAVIKIIVELGEFILQEPISNAYYGQGNRRWQAYAGWPQLLLAGLSLQEGHPGLQGARGQVISVEGHGHGRRLES